MPILRDDDDLEVVMRLDEMEAQVLGAAALPSSNVSAGSSSSPTSGGNRTMEEEEDIGARLPVQQQQQHDAADNNNSNNKKRASIITWVPSFVSSSSSMYLPRPDCVLSLPVSTIRELLFFNPATDEPLGFDTATRVAASDGTARTVLERTQASILTAASAKMFLDVVSNNRRGGGGGDDTATKICRIWFHLIPREDSATTGGGYLIPAPDYCMVSSVLSTFAEGMSETALVDDDGGGGASMVIPIAVQNLTLEVIGLVASYIFVYSCATTAKNLAFQSDGDGYACMGEHLVPSPLPKPYPHSTFKGACEFEQSVFNVLADNLEFSLGVINAANFLGVKPLVHLAAMSIALRLRKKTPQQIRSLFSDTRLPTIPME